MAETGTMLRLKNGRTLKQQQYQNEREVLALVRAQNRKGRGFRPCLFSLSHWNALNRLEEKGKVELTRLLPSGCNYRAAGYWVGKRLSTGGRGNDLTPGPAKVLTKKENEK
jgi:hypothetical protein